MWRTPLCGIVLIFLPLASSAQPWEDGGTHFVDGFVASIDAFVRDGPGSMTTTVNFIAGGEVGAIQVEDSSVLNIFAGAMVDEANYILTSNGAICGGELQRLDVVASSTVEVNGGTFTDVAPPVSITGGTLIVQGGSIQSTKLINPVALMLSGGVAEIRGGTVVNGKILTGPSAQVTISGGQLNTQEIAVGATVSAGGSVTIKGTSFNLPFGSVPGGYNDTLSGTLADGSPLATNLQTTTVSPVFLVEGTQGPLTSTVCGNVPTNVPALPPWAIGVGVLALLAMAAEFARGRRPER